MNEDQFLEKILKSHSLNDNSKELKELRKKKIEVTKLIEEEFEESSPNIREGGSLAKKTMIKDSYDGDIPCYFESDDTKPGSNLKEIYENVATALEKKYLVERKASALRILDTDNKSYTHIDVVPGRYVDDSKGDAYIHLKGREKSRLKTNLDKHIEHIRDSGHRDAIKMVKLWKHRNLLKTKTFVLELVVIEVLNDMKKTDKLSQKLRTFFLEVSSNIDDITIKDPANEGNDLSEIFDYGVRVTLKSHAEMAVNHLETNSDPIKAWEKIFGLPLADDDKASIAIISDLKSRPAQKPWGF